VRGSERAGGEAGGRIVRATQRKWCVMAGDMSDAKFLTVAEVAAMMRVSKMTVYRLVHNGELPAVRVGRSFRVVEDDVNDYLRKSFYNAG
jgi:excisionase family DNA binding protein